MVQGYYTLEEAAQILQMPSDELNQMRERKEIRAFADRGTWRFRTQDIEELARRRGAASDPELPIQAPGRTRTPGDAGEVFQFPLEGSGELPLPPLPDDSSVPIGRERPGDSARMRRPDSKRTDSKRTDSSKKRTPYPPSGGDSDVRLVAEGSDVGFHIASDSDVKLEDQAASGRVPPSSARRQKPPSTGRTESGVRLVDDKTSDSDVKIIPDSGSEIPLGETPAIDSGTESDVRLDLAGAAGSKRKLESDSFLTEEIDLDAELRKAEEAARAQRSEAKPPKVKGKTPPPSSPFELSEMDLHLPPAGTGSSTEGLARRIQEDSSDFDLTLDPSDNLSPLEPSSGEHAALSDSAIGQASAKVASSQDSGINLEEPSDAGISLESETTSSQDIDFELSVDEPPARKSSKKRAEEKEKERKPDSSSEFELTLDDSVRLAHDNVPTDSIRVESARLAQGPSSDVRKGGLDSAPLARGDSSRRDSGRQSARLDSAPLAKGDSSRRGDSAPLAKSDSKKKKNISQQDSVRVRPKALDSMRVRDESARLADSSRLVPVDDDGTALKPEESGEDIFETDFEVPALEAESGSEVVPLDESDTDLESSDFDLALSDDDIATQSSKRRSAQVVPVDEEDVDEGAATISKKRSFVEEVDGDSGETAAVAELEEEAEEAQVTPSRRKAVLVPAAPADWGVFAPVTLMVSTLFMFFVALMSIELMNGMWGFHQPTKASSLMIKVFGGMIPGVDSKDLERD